MSENYEYKQGHQHSLNFTSHAKIDFRSDTNQFRVSMKSN